MTTTTAAEHRVDLAVVGGGPAGLAAAIEARRLGVGRVVVLEREQEAGGIPRHTAHTGFGVRDLHRLLSGPAYARRLVADAAAAGVELRTGATAVAWHDGLGRGTCLDVHDRDGVRPLAARAVVLATGTRERPRAARLIPGGRPLGVYTTAAVQQLVALHGVVPGRRAVVVGAEHVSFSVVDTLAHGGCSTAAIVTGNPAHQSYAPLVWATAGRRGVPVRTGVTVAEVIGDGRVRAVRLTDGTEVACDTVVFTGDWIAEHDLARRGGLTIAGAATGPAVDAGLRTSRPGVFAAGNLLHGALQADWCALDGRHAAHAVARWLTSGSVTWPVPDRSVAVTVAAPLAWCTPQRVARGEALPHGRLVLAGDQPGERRALGRLRVEVRQGERQLWLGWSRTPVAPGRPFTIDAGWVRSVDPDGDAVIVRQAERRRR